MKDADEPRWVIVAFRAPKNLVCAIENAAAAECISKSDVMRRSCIRDLMPQRKRLSGEAA